MYKLGSRDEHDQSVETNPTISNSERVIVCPNDSIKHNVVIKNLPLCFAILQHLPGVKESKEFGALFKNGVPPLPGVSSELENIRQEFKSIFKKATDEYKKCKFWDDTIKMVRNALDDF